MRFQSPSVLVVESSSYRINRPDWPVLHSATRKKPVRKKSSTYKSKRSRRKKVVLRPPNCIWLSACVYPLMEAAGWGEGGGLCVGLWLYLCICESPFKIVITRTTYTLRKCVRSDQVHSELFSVCPACILCVSALLLTSVLWIRIKFFSDRDQTFQIIRIQGAPDQDPVSDPTWMVQNFLT